jgi:hypothetical protein
VVLTDLDKMRDRMYEYEKVAKLDDIKAEWYHFMTISLHINLRQLDVPSSGKTNLAESRAALLHLLDAVAVKCPKLVSIHMLFDYVEERSETFGSFLGLSLLIKLPKLGANLQVVVLESFDLNDWALQQFALHTPLLV